MSLTAEDRFEIQDLLLRYAAIRDREREAFFALFTDDVVLEGPRGSWRGHEGVAHFWEQFERAEGRSPYHRGPMITNVLVDGHGDRATMTAQFLQVKGEPGEPRTIQTGWYECELRRVDGSWKLSKRVTHVDGVPLYRDTEAFRTGARWTSRDGEYVLEPPPTP